jgi:hypothetical protein
MNSESTRAEEAQEAEVKRVAGVVDAHLPCLDFVFASRADCQVGGKE